MQLETELNDLDAITGDGDCGSTVKSGALAVMKAIEHVQPSPSGMLFIIAKVLEDKMGGSSGSLLSLLFTAFAADIKVNGEQIDLLNLTRGLGEGIVAMMEVGRASRGDRTMLDALIPAHEALEVASKEKSTDPVALSNAAKAAYNGAELTRTLTAKAGRAAYCKDRNTGHAADPGAVMISHVFALLAKSVA